MLAVYLVPALYLLFLSIVRPHTAEHEALIALLIVVASVAILLVIRRVLPWKGRPLRTLGVLGLELALLGILAKTPFHAMHWLRDSAQRRTSISEFSDRPLVVDGHTIGVDVSFEFTPAEIPGAANVTSPIGRLMFQLDYPQEYVRSIYAGEVYDLELQEVTVEPPRSNEWEGYQAGTTYRVRAKAFPNYLGKENGQFCFDPGYKDAEGKVRSIQVDGPFAVRVVFESVRSSASQRDCTAGDNYGGCPFVLVTRETYDPLAMYRAAVAVSQGRECAPSKGGRGASTPF